MLMTPLSSLSTIFLLPMDMPDVSSSSMVYGSHRLFLPLLFLEQFSDLYRQILLQNIKIIILVDKQVLSRAQSNVLQLADGLEQQIFLKGQFSLKQMSCMMSMEYKHMLDIFLEILIPWFNFGKMLTMLVLVIQEFQNQMHILGEIVCCVLYRIEQVLRHFSQPLHLARA